MAVELGDVRADLQPVMGRQAGRVDPRSGYDDHPQVGHSLLCLGEGRDYPPQQVAADSRAAHGHDADALVGVVAESLAVPELARVEASDIAGEVVVLLGP